MAKAQAEAAASSSSAAAEERDPDNECAICFDDLSTGKTVALPCTHKFHAVCLDKVREFSIQQLCPMCRAALPPGADQQYHEAIFAFIRLTIRYQCGRCGSDDSSFAVQTFRPINDSHDRRAMADVLRLLQAAAEHGHEQACFWLGQIYEFAQGVRRDRVAAFTWFQRAADLGNAPGQFNVGLTFEHGYGGVEIKMTEALRYYQASANQGNSKGQANLAQLLWKGKGVAQNRVEAVRWFQKAADQGDASAMNKLAEAYEEGLGGLPQNYAKAATLYRAACGKGNTGAMNGLGILYLEGKGVPRDGNEARKLFLAAHRGGNSDAIGNIGLMVSRNYSLRLLLRLCNLLIPFLHRRHEMKYLYGNGVKQNAKTAAEWFRKSADLGESTCMCNLALAYSTGGVDLAQDDRAAAQWYKKAAVAGNARGMLYFSQMCLHGQGTVKDEKEATKWLHKSADLGLAGAQYNIGVYYYKGLYGVQKNAQVAMRYLRLAAKKDRGDCSHHNDEEQRQNALKAIQHIEKDEAVAKEEDKHCAATAMIEAHFCGKRAVLKNLTKRPELNGSRGVIEEVILPWEAARAKNDHTILQDPTYFRFVVKLDANKGTFKLKVDNFEMFLIEDVPNSSLSPEVRANLENLGGGVHKMSDVLGVNDENGRGAAAGE